MRRAHINIFSLAGEEGRAAAWRLHDKLLHNGKLDATVARALYSICREAEEYSVVSHSMRTCGGVSPEDQDENEAWGQRNRPMRGYFINNGDNANEAHREVLGPSAAQHFAALLRDPVALLERQSKLPALYV